MFVIVNLRTMGKNKYYLNLSLNRFIFVYRTISNATINTPRNQLPKKKKPQEGPEEIARIKYVEGKDGEQGFTRITYPDGKTEEGFSFADSFIKLDGLSPAEIEAYRAVRSPGKFIISLKGVKRVFAGYLGKEQPKNLAKLTIEQIIVLSQSQKFEDITGQIKEETGYAWEFGSIHRSWISLLALIIQESERTGNKSWTPGDLEDFLKAQEKSSSIPAIPTAWGDLSKSPAGGLPWTDPHISMDFEKICWDLLNKLSWMEFSDILGRKERELKEAKQKLKTAEQQLDLLSPYIMSPTKSRYFRSKPQENLDSEILFIPRKDNKGQDADRHTVSIPLKKDDKVNLSATMQTTLNLDGMSGEDIAVKLDLNARKLGWTAFDEKFFDLCIWFADRHPDKNGAFVYDPSAFGKLLFPGRQRLGKQDYNRMHVSLTRLVTQRYDFSCSGEYEVRGFRLIADFGEIVKKTVGLRHGKDRREEVTEVYAGGIFQIFGGIWEDIKSWRCLAPIELKNVGLPDPLYPLNRAIKYHARTNWKKTIENKGVCKLSLFSLILTANITISPNNEKREIKKIHERLDGLVDEKMLVDWWIMGAKGGGRINKGWYKKARLVKKETVGDGEIIYRTRWDRMDKSYCFLLPDNWIDFCLKGIEKGNKKLSS